MIGNVQQLGKGGFLGIPEEIHVRIMLNPELGVGDILTCEKLCSTLAGVVERSKVLQYKVELGKAGMIDGPPGDAKLVQRLTALQAYQATWKTHNISLVAYPSPRAKAYNTRGILLLPGRYLEMIVRRPATLFNGIEERTWTVDLADNDFESHQDIGSCAVDVPNDLLVLTKVIMGENPQCLFLSLSQRGTPHPLASQHIFDEYVDTLSISIDPEDKVEVYGDLVGWTIASDATNMLVWNWKTGVHIWGDSIWDDMDMQEQEYDDRCHIVDESHILVVRRSGIFVYKPDPPPANPNRMPGPGRLLCHLQLPPLADGLSAYNVDSALHYPPVYDDSEQLFRRDPTATILVLKYGVQRRSRYEMYGQSIGREVIIMIPVTTILEQASRSLLSEENDNQDASGGEESKSGDSGETRVVPWDEWGASGARLVTTNAETESVSALGSLCTVSFGNSVSRTLDCYAFDVHRWAQSVAGQGNLGDRVQISDLIEDKAIFKNAVRTTFPYRVTRKQSPVQYTNYTASPSYDGLWHYGNTAWLPLRTR